MTRSATSDTLPATAIAWPRAVLGFGRSRHALGLGRYWTLVSLFASFETRRRYRRPVGRVALVVVQPLLMTAVAIVAFGPAGIGSEGLPYPVYVFSALLPWQLIQSALVGADRILGSRERFIPRVGCPAIVVPFAAIGASLVDSIPTSLVLLLMIVYYDVPLTGSLWTLPLWVLAGVLTALGIALWLLPLRVRHGGVQSAVPFLSQIWLLATPVFWSSATVPAAWHPLLGVNPMAGVTQGFRWALFGTTIRPQALSVTVSAAVIAVILVTGWIYCRRDRLGDLLEFRVVRQGPRQ